MTTFLRRQLRPAVVILVPFLGIKLIYVLVTAIGLA